MVAVSATIILILVILVGLVFALTNGLHDASSVVATFINCSAASPKQAVAVASSFGLLGAILGGNLVADTISELTDLPTDTSLLTILFAAVLGATLWNLITWRLGLPSSSTHALIGGIIGAVVVSSGYQHIAWGWTELIGSDHQITGIVKIVIALFLSPFIGFAIAFCLEKIARLLLRNSKFHINEGINRLQWVIVAGLSFSHGSNDTQKIMGILTLALAAWGGTAIQAAPLWVRVCGGIVMFMGTMLGGWSIMRTLGRGIFDIKPIHSLNSQLASLGSIFGASLIGAPVSTTHVVVGSIMGVGAADEYRMVHWEIVKEIGIAWCITIPLSALVSGLIYTITTSIVTVI
ncbi:inorganic phosphate transporter [Acetobacterium paludosum]|uniref:Inorganic phosphate transporter n=1 Tax=Acetobacterium paludosum TaxID=52693 RepID=A0A923HUY6_9FIRM|nr:inorganic phosphate transporter [Acetobacterium paludosum]MBC3888781.1 inorganic phosphate transporter [Acetobacterium paludosum]